jgi:hypothetical protein
VAARFFKGEELKTPALAPGMGYDGMEVSNGTAARLMWESLISGDCSEAKHQRKREALLRYCAQDTLGMVRILGFLSSVIA